MKAHVVLAAIGIFLGAVLTPASLIWPELGLLVGAVGTASTLTAAYLLSQGE